MSHIGWIPLPGPPKRSSWSLFPWIVAASMLVVVIVNIGLVYAALKTFPGKAGDDGFDLSNHYNFVLDEAERQASLGWQVEARTDDGRRPVVTLTDRRGAPLVGVFVTAVAERPLGAEEARRLTFHELGAGRYVADTTLTLVGQWDLAVTGSAHGHEFAVTRRVIVR